MAIVRVPTTYCTTPASFPCCVAFRPARCLALAAICDSDLRGCSLAVPTCCPWFHRPRPRRRPRPLPLAACRSPLAPRSWQFVARQAMGPSDADEYAGAPVPAKAATADAATPSGLPRVQSEPFYWASNPTSVTIPPNLDVDDDDGGDDSGGSSQQAGKLSACHATPRKTPLYAIARMDARARVDRHHHAPNPPLPSLVCLPACLPACQLACVHAPQVPLHLGSRGIGLTMARRRRRGGGSRRAM